MKTFVLHTEQGDIYAYTIKNEEIEVTALNYGASITSIKTKDRNGTFENVVAAYDHMQDYILKPGPYLNALVGPVAGRIAHGKYMLDEELQQLSINNGINHLHGGKSGISKKFFDVMEKENGLEFFLETDHVEDGYKGTFVYKISYILEGNTLRIEYTCIPEEKTLLNMTSHMYFNLSGDMKRSVYDQYLMIPSTKKLKIHKDGYPCQIEEIEKESAFDFQVSKNIKENFDKGSNEFHLTKGYDTPFLLDKGNTICLEDPVSQRKLSIITDQSCVVVYSANYFDDGMILNGNHKAYPFCAIALETQDMPNGINIAKEKSNQIFDREHPYHQTTRYVFSNGGIK